MAYLNFEQHTHSDRLERWLGADQVQRVTDSMREWYGPPIALAGVPGNVRAAKGGACLLSIRRDLRGLLC